MKVSYFFKYIFVVWILVLVSANVINASPDEELKINRFGSEEITNFQSDDDFFYLDEDESKTDNSSMLTSWFRNMINMYFNNSFSHFLLNNLHYIILIIAIIFTLIKVGKLEFGSVSFKSRNNNFATVYTDHEDVHKIDFDKAIQKALKQNNYRLAIRFHYLNILKQLSLSGIIEHSIHKTNMEYMYEIKEENIRSKFKEVAFIFDYIWYGETIIDKKDYLLLEPVLHEFESDFINTKDIKTS